MSATIAILARDLDPLAAERIRSVSEEVELIVADSDEQFDELLPRVDVLIGEMQPHQVARAAKVRWVAYQSAGIDHMMNDEIRDSELIITSAKGFVGVHLAEHAFALLLGLTRDIALCARRGTWNKTDGLMGRELMGNCIGIVGLGGAGSETAKRAHAFGIEVLAVDPTPARVPDYVSCWGMDRFYDLLGAADVVVICAPLTAQTEGMFDAEAFRHMKPGALLINISRGKIVEEAALLEALQTGAIAGAGLDVLPTEPVPDDHPLWSMENVIITPHIAGVSPLRFERWLDTFCENLRRFVAGEDDLESRIDQRRGY